MKSENIKYWIIGLLLIIGLVWFFWEKIEKVIPEALKNSGTSGGSSSVAAPAPVAASTIAAANQIAASDTVAANPKYRSFYPYGSGGFYYDDQKNPVIQDELAMVSFNARNNRRGSFIRLN